MDIVIIIVVVIIGIAKETTKTFLEDGRSGAVCGSVEQ